LAATRATVKDPSRFEGYALAALALHVHGSDQQAKPFADKALRLGPPAKVHLLRELDAQISARISAASTAVHKPDAPNPEMRRKLDLLRLIIEDADKARTPEERKKYLQEFLNKSEPFVTEYPNDAQIWLLRGAAAVELEYAAAAGPGREAALHLIKLGLDKSNEDKVRILMAKMDRRGWIYEMNLQAEPQVADFNNALRAMGTVKGSGSFPDAGGQSYISKDFSYGDLQGTCESGFDIESTVKVRDNFSPTDSDTGPRRTTADEVAVLHIGLTEPRFCSYAVPDKAFNKSLVVIQPRYEIRNKRGQEREVLCLPIVPLGRSTGYPDRDSFFDLDAIIRTGGELSCGHCLSPSLHSFSQWR
jgi:hypothetical protein